MGIRATIQKNPAVGVALAVAVIVLAVVVYFVFQEPERDLYNREKLWYFDLNTKQKFAIDYNPTIEVPPNAAPSGPLKEGYPQLPAGSPAGARLFRFACGDCSNEQFDGFIKIFTLEAQKKWLEEKVPYNTIQDQILIKPLEGGEWVPENSPQAMKIKTAIGDRCRKLNLKARGCEVND